MQPFFCILHPIIRTKINKIFLIRDVCAMSKHKNGPIHTISRWFWYLQLQSDVNELISLLVRYWDWSLYFKVQPSEFHISYDILKRLMHPSPVGQLYERAQYGLVSQRLWCLRGSSLTFYFLQVVVWDVWIVARAQIFLTSAKSLLKDNIAWFIWIWDLEGSLVGEKVRWIILTLLALRFL